MLSPFSVLSNWFSKLDCGLVVVVEKGGTRELTVRMVRTMAKTRSAAFRQQVELCQLEADVAVATRAAIRPATERLRISAPSVSEVGPAPRAETHRCAPRRPPGYHHRSCGLRRVAQVVGLSVPSGWDVTSKRHMDESRYGTCSGLIRVPLQGEGHELCGLDGPDNGLIMG